MAPEPGAPGPEARPVQGVALENGRPVIDAAVLAARFGLGEGALRAEMRAGRLTSLVERGEGEDAGRLRLTFRHGAAVWALRLDPDGRAWETAPRPAEPALFRMIEAARSGSAPG